MSHALRVNLATGEAFPIEVHGNDDILKHFITDVRGKTLEKLSENLFLREWRSIHPQSSQVVIRDCYDGVSLQRVDIPETAEANFKISI
jgi:hypothetical protein